jgi:hypothetical protein
MTWIRIPRPFRAASSSPPPAAADSVPTAVDHNASWRGRIGEIQSTAKWLIGAFAATGTVLVAGSQLSDLGEVTDPDRLALAFVGAALALVGIGIAVWSLGNAVSPQAPTSTGDLVVLEQKRNSLFGKIVARSPELLQEQATSVAELHKRLVAARVRRLAAEEKRDADPKNARAAAEYAACDRRVQDLRTVAGQLRPIGAYSAAHDAFRRARIVGFAGAALVAAGATIFAYAAHPSKAQAAAVAAVNPVPSEVILRLSDEGRGRLTGVVGVGCTGDVAALVLSGGPQVWDVVLVDERCPAARFTLTADLGDLRPRATAWTPPAR